MGSDAGEGVLGISRVIFENPLALVCQALGWVLSIFSHENSVPRRGAECVWG